MCCMVHEGTTNQFHAILIKELPIKNIIWDSAGLFPAYIIYRTRIRMPIDMMDGV